MHDALLALAIALGSGAVFGLGYFQRVLDERRWQARLDAIRTVDELALELAKPDGFLTTDEVAKLRLVLYQLKATHGEAQA